MNTISTKPSGRSLRCLLLLTVFSFISIASTRSFGQGTLCDSCPAVPTDDAQHGTATPAWSGGSKDYTYRKADLTTCTISICYACRQTSARNFDYTVTQVCVDSECLASLGITLDSLTNWAVHTVLMDNPCGFTCPTCPSTDIEWQENQMTCWQKIVIFNPFTGRKRIIHRACSTHGWCLNAYSVCCDADGTKHFTFKGHIEVTNTCGTNCHNLTCPQHF